MGNLRSGNANPNGGFFQIQLRQNTALLKDINSSGANLGLLGEHRSANVQTTPPRSFHFRRPVGVYVLARLRFLKSVTEGLRCLFGCLPISALNTSNRAGTQGRASREPHLFAGETCLLPSSPE